ncbi:hypothetical protein E6H31_09630 [Candidatus Bathyarchaeota archaeon]|nr:MAG: hypothetical protein E6H31_09630 [Candidatus Bathyarchaeota archaeon]
MKLDNYITSSTARVKSDKNVPRANFETVKAIAEKKLHEAQAARSKADLNGVTVEFYGNSKHQKDFWKLNWKEAPDSSHPDARIYSAYGVEGREPTAYYCPETHESVFFNTEYYGQCKSWALGMAAAIMEEKRNTHSIHGACVDVSGKGVIIVAPTGTGKTTQAFKLMELPGGRIVGDDWVYIDHNEGEQLRHLVGRQPEKSLYMRTETQMSKPWLRKIFDKSKCENITTTKESCEFTEGLTGCKLTSGKCVFDEGLHWCLLRRDDKSPPEVHLDADGAIKVLRKGEYMVRPGAGPKEMWGKLASEPWYNPYLLLLDHARQEQFFRRMISKFDVKCILLNTGVDSIDGTHKRIISTLDDT